MVPYRENILMALALDHFFRGLIITSGAVAVASTAGYYKDQLGSVLSNAPSPEEGPNDNKELNDKIKALGISNVNCLLENNKSIRECELSLEEMKEINFYDKESGKEFPISGLENPKKMNLRIEKGYEDSEFHSGLRLTFTNKNNGDVSMGEESNKTTFKQNVGRDYKIQTGDQTKIMEAWTLQILSGKVGMTIDDSQNSVCNLNENPSNKVNVWKSESEYVMGADAKKTSSCQMSVEKDSAGYMEGFKFTVSGDTDIALSGGTSPDGGKTVEKITKEGVSYEIGPKEVNGTKKWFLIERASS